MKKNTKIVIGIIIVLVIGLAIFSVLNRGDLELKQKLQSNAQFQINYDDKTITVTMDDMINLSPVEFEANYDTSNNSGEIVKFTGVEIKNIFKKYDIEINDDNVIEVKALDGYSSALTGSEVLTDDNTYICLLKEGESLGTKSDGGMGPYLMIIKSSNFSQRWCKFVQEINVR